MTSTRPPWRYRKIADGTTVINVSEPFQPRVIEGRTGRVLASIMRAYAAWHRKRMSPEKLERSRREQELLAARLHER
jgi:hypothetical protein